jgi:hypothetical protein
MKRLARARKLLRKAGRALERAQLINDYLEVFYDQNHKPSLEWRASKYKVQEDK